MILLQDLVAALSLVNLAFLFARRLRFVIMCEIGLNIASLLFCLYLFRCKQRKCSFPMKLRHRSQCILLDKYVVEQHEVVMFHFITVKWNKKDMWFSDEHNVHLCLAACNANPPNKIQRNKWPPEVNKLVIIIHIKAACLKCYGAENTEHMNGALAATS